VSGNPVVRCPRKSTEGPEHHPTARLEGGQKRSPPGRFMAQNTTPQPAGAMDGREHHPTARLEGGQKKPAGAMDGREHHPTARLEGGQKRSPPGHGWPRTPPNRPPGGRAKKKPAGAMDGPAGVKWRGQDSNLRPRGYEPRELPGCSTPRPLGVLLMSSKGRRSITFPRGGRKKTASERERSKTALSKVDRRTIPSKAC
jgi:hypothetical protein